MARSVLTVLLVMLLGASSASAKDFQPGDLRVCGAGGHCVSIVEQPVLDSIGSFYYSGGRPQAAATPRLGEPEFQLVFPDGYVTGIVVAGRFLSYGVNLNRFNTSAWYRLPSRAASALRKLSRSLRPVHLSVCALSLSNEGPTSSDLARCAAMPATTRRDRDWMR
jgi:hypothetical protein